MCITLGIFKYSIMVSLLQEKTFTLGRYDEPKFKIVYNQPKRGGIFFLVSCNKFVPILLVSYHEL